MSELACYDGNLSDIIDMLPEKGSYNKGVKILREKMIYKLIDQLKNNGSTLFFDIDELSTRDASVLIPLILKRRKKELQRLRLYESSGYVDLTPLWKTGYGYEILKVLNLKKTIHVKEFKKVRDAFSKIGIRLRLTAELKKAKKNPTPKLSQTLSKFVVPSH
jgi:hypothetical protein